MEHLPLLFYLFTIISGFAFAGFLIYLNAHYKHPLLKLYTMQHIAFSFILLLHAVSLYSYINTKIYSEFIEVMKIYVTLSLYFVGIVTNYQGQAVFFVTGINYTRNFKILLITISVIPPILATYMILTEISPEITGFAMGIWLLFQISLVFLGIFRYKHIHDPLLKFILKTFFALVLFSFPIGFIDYFEQKKQVLQNKYPIGIMGEPLTYLIGICVVILVLLKARKIYSSNSSSIPSAFLIRFKLTEREQEIIKMLIGGLSNKEIASKLFLSPATVRNHISNIFEKTSTSTRGKLLNLLNGFQDGSGQNRKI